MSNNKKFEEYIKKEIESNKQPEEHLVIMHKYLGNEEKVKKMLQHLMIIGYRLSSSRLGGTPQNILTAHK